MIIHKIVVQNFFGFKREEVTLPATGVVVVSGLNGKGKTARYITAESWIGWGETERGTPPYAAEGKPNVAGLMEVTIKGRPVTVKRSWKGGKKLVEFSVDGNAPVEYSTSSKAQAALEEVLGDFMTWRRTHVFSGADAAAFSHADDATRKRLLETMLTLDVFDGPLKEARERLKASSLVLTATAAKAQRIADRRAMIIQQAKDVKQLIGADVPDVAKLERRIAKAHSIKLELATEQQTIQREMGRAHAALNQANAELRKVGDGTCRTCGQKLPHADVSAQQKAVEEAQLAAEAASAGAAERQQELRTTIYEMDKAIQEASVQIAGAEKSSKAEAMLEKYRADAIALRDDILTLNVEIAELEYRHEVIEQASKVLSTKGVRSMLLGRALSSLSDLANAYLERLRPGTWIELLPTSETKSGKTVDTIALNIHGMGGGWGYKAASGGERKRIDIAILLALSTLAGSDGTLIFDEAMDAIDTAGVEAVSSLLLDVSQKRPVVIITHNAELAESLAGATRVQIK